jgi:hypothetical protein
MIFNSRPRTEPGREPTSEQDRATYFVNGRAASSFTEAA